jgi:WD40 repeat protein
MKKENPHIEYQLDFARFAEIKNYDFKGDYTVNPLVQLYPFYKSEINLPIYTNENLNICNRLLAVCPNITDRKPVNCVKIYSNSKKLICGTSIGNLVIYDLYYNDFTFSTKITAHQSSIRAIQFTKTENALLTGDNQGFIIHFDEKLQQRNKIKAHNDKESVTDINFSISDTKFISSSDDKTAKIFDLNTGTDEFVFNGKFVV